MIFSVNVHEGERRLRIRALDLDHEFRYPFDCNTNIDIMPIFGTKIMPCNSLPLEAHQVPSEAHTETYTL